MQWEEYNHKLSRPTLGVSKKERELIYKMNKAGVTQKLISETTHLNLPEQGYEIRHSRKTNNRTDSEL